jgi:signal transduction histidine kinase
MLANSSTLAVGTPLIPALLSLLIATTIALAFAAYTGSRGRRKPHLVCVSISVLLFLLTVFAAELLGRAYIFQPAALAVHLWFAHAATVALLATAVTGMIRLQKGTAVRAHRGSVIAFAILLLLAVGTGGFMLQSGVPRAAEGHAPQKAPAMDAALRRDPTR